MNGSRRPVDPRRLVAYAFIAGMVLAPFVALIYGWNIGLAVMALALAATVSIALDAYRTADEAARPRVRHLAAINGALCLLCVLLLLLRVR